MTKITLHYFDLRGRGEIIRLILKFADVEFEDHRIAFADWPNEKSKYPAGQLPCLKIGDKCFNQSICIARMLARDYGLGGKTSAEMCRIDAAVDTMVDLLHKMYGAKFESKLEGDALAAKMAEIGDSQGKQTFARLLEIKKERNGKFMFGNEMTWADLFMAEATFQLQKWLKAGQICEELLELQKAVFCHEQLADYIKSRKDSDI